MFTWEVSVSKVLIVTVLTIFVLLNFAHGSRQEKNMLNIAIRKFSSNIDPVKAFNFHHFIIIQCLMETLVNLDETGNISSEVARNWTVSDDGLLYTFEIEKDAKFQDGSSVTAEDVYFSLARHLDPESKSIVKSYLDPIIGAGKENGQIEGIKILSPKKLSIKLNHKSPSFLYVLTMPSFSIISKSAYEAGVVLGSGRMKLKEEGDKIFLEPWSKYRGEKPILERINITELTPNLDIQKLFAEKKVDLVIGLSKAKAEEIEEENIIKSSVKTLTYSHLFFNNNSKMFESKEFRKDLTLFLQGIAKKAASQYEFFDFLPNFFPRGIMPASYYKDDLDFVSGEEFGKTWNSKIPKDKIKLSLVKRVYSQKFLDILDSEIAKNSLKIEIVEVKAEDFLQRLRDKKYDVITGVYLGNFPDPDGFIHQILPSNDTSFGVMPIEAQLKNIQKINDIDDKYERLNSYASLFSKIENEYYFAPLFRDKIPLIYRKGLNITKSEYRYESELWKIFWKE